MPKNSLNVSLKGADDIFSTEESRQEQQREQVQQIPIAERYTLIKFIMPNQPIPLRNIDIQIFSNRRENRNHQFTGILRRINSVLNTDKVYPKILHNL